MDNITKQASLDLINAASMKSFDDRDYNDRWNDVTVLTFVNAGITDVTLDNLSSVQYVLESSSLPYPRTATQIQALVYEALAGLALTEISNYFFDPYFMPKPSAATFAVAGVTGVTDDNLDDVLEAINDAKNEMRDPWDTRPPFSLTNKDDLQAVVDNLLLI